MSHNDYLRRAIELSRKSLADGLSPFAALIVKDDRVLGSGRNGTQEQTDPLAHAEIVAIRTASMHHGSATLAGSTLYTSCEPCLMCTAACHYAGIGSVVFAAGLGDVIELSSGDLPIGAADFANYSGMQINFIQRDRAEAVEVVRAFYRRHGHL